MGTRINNLMSQNWSKIHSVVDLTYPRISKRSLNKLNLSHSGSWTLSISPNKRLQPEFNSPLLIFSFLSSGCWAFFLLFFPTLLSLCECTGDIVVQGGAAWRGGGSEWAGQNDCWWTCSIHPDCLWELHILTKLSLRCQWKLLLILSFMQSVFPPQYYRPFPNPPTICRQPPVEALHSLHLCIHSLLPLPGILSKSLLRFFFFFPRENLGKVYNGLKECVVIWCCTLTQMITIISGSLFFFSFPNTF